jgi:hypothetical protein
MPDTLSKKVKELRTLIGDGYKFDEAVCDILEVINAQAVTSTPPPPPKPLTPPDDKTK